MTIRTHSVKHVRSKYRRFQFVAAFFATLTIAAGFFTAASGLQITRLKKMQPPPVEPIIAPDPNAEKALNQKIESLNAKLVEEQTTAQGLRKKIKSLERRLAAVKKAAAPAPKPKPAPAPEPLPAEKPAEASPQAPTPAPAPKPLPEPAPAPAPQPAPSAPENDATPDTSPPPAAPTSNAPQATPPITTTQPGTPAPPAEDQPLATEAIPNEKSAQQP